MPKVQPVSARLHFLIDFFRNNGIVSDRMRARSTFMIIMLACIVYRSFAAQFY